MKRLFKLLPILAVLSALLMPMPAFAAATLDDAIKDIADRIEKYLQDKNQLEINIKDFEGPPNTSSGRKVKNLLKDQLEARNIKVEPFSNWEVRGDIVVSTEGRFATVALITRLVNNQGLEVADFRQRVEDPVDDLKDIIDIAQPPGVDLTSVSVDASESTAQGSSPQSSTGSSSSGTESSAAQASTGQSATPPVTSPPISSTPSGTPTTPPVSGGAGNSGAVANGTSPAGSPQGSQVSLLPDSQERDQRVLQSLENPGFFSVNPSTIAASSSSPFHVAVKVRHADSPTYEPINIQKVGNGLAFCDLQEGDQYSVVVTNTSPFDVGVELKIDGINSLIFSEVPGFAETGKWLIRGTNKNGGVPFSARIDGWYRNPESVDSFHVSSEPDAVATELGSPARIGTITATFFGAWQEGEPVHPLEQQLAAGPGNARGLGTARGETLGSRSTIARTHFGVHPLASVSIRYVNPEPPVDLPIEAAN
ncbi:MAG: hypothetical protein KDA93_07610 [Planctomycetaceae bacterium]|nr:hypothetical protein [Planctomycetaceae bacterium]